MDSNNKWFGFFPKHLSKEQVSGTGMAMALILIYIGLHTKNFLYFKISLILLLINMVYPMIFYPLAIIWFGLSDLIGAVMSRIILALLFALLVFPVGIIRRLSGKDSLQLYIWKKGKHSVMKNRNYSYTASDLEQPY
jgi:hypothetical protein